MFQPMIVWLVYWTGEIDGENTCHFPTSDMAYDYIDKLYNRKPLYDYFICGMYEEEAEAIIDGYDDPDMSDDYKVTFSDKKYATAFDDDIKYSLIGTEEEDRVDTLLEDMVSDRSDNPDELIMSPPIRIQYFIRYSQSGSSTIPYCDTRGDIIYFHRLGEAIRRIKWLDNVKHDNRRISAQVIKIDCSKDNGGEIVYLHSTPE